MQTFLTFFNFFKEAVIKYAQRYQNFVQGIYDLITLKALTMPFLGRLILLWHRFIILYGLAAEEVANWVGGTKNLNILVLFLTFALKRFDGYVVLGALMLFKLNFSWLGVKRFYTQRQTLLLKNFPEIQDPKSRMHRAAQILSQAAQNPAVVTVATAAVGAATWKALDIIEAGRQSDIAEKDRRQAAEQADKDRQQAAEQADKDRQHTAEQADKDRQHTAEQADKDRQHTAEQAELDRIEQRRAAAYDKLNSPEFKDLSNVQKENIEYTLQTGVYKTPVGETTNLMTDLD